MKKTTQTVFGALLLTAVLLIPAFAQDNAVAGKQTSDHENRYEATINRLNLSAEQKEKIKALRQNQKQQMVGLHQSLKEARAKLKEHLDNPEATRESTAPLANDIKNILAQMVDQRVEGILAVKSILTPEQFNQLQQGRQKMRDNEKGCRPFWLGKKRANRGENTQKPEDSKDE